MNFPYIIVQPQGGLCNRMRTIAGAYKLAQTINKKLIVFWVRNDELNERFDNLFVLTPFKVIDDHPGSFIQKWLWRIANRTDFFTLIDDQTILNSDFRNSPISEWAKELSYSNLLICACHDITKDCDYSIFKPLDAIRNRCPISKEENVIGIHIRRTDNVESVKFSPTELFVQRMNETIDNHGEVKFFLATDDPKEEAYLQEIYGNRIIVNHKTSLDRNNPIAIQEALLDLYTLTQCREIYGSYYSSFSDVAAIWGGVSKDTIILRA